MGVAEEPGKEGVRVYAGGGSRRTPPEVLALMERVALRLAELGFLLRTGGAEGADEAFLRGCLRGGGEAEVYLPWPGFRRHKGTLQRPLPEAFELAAQRHPAWERLSPSVQALMARNVHVLLGPNLDTPARFFVCWTPGGETVGGTGHALRVALAHGIPVANLAEGRKALQRIAEGL